MISLRSSSKNSPGNNAPNDPACASPLAPSAAASSPIASSPHAITSATVTTSAIASAVTAGIVRNSIRGRGTGPSSSARSPLTAAWVCSSWRSIRARWAVISRFRAVRSGASSTALIESSGMPRSRSRLITWAAATWSAP